MLHMLSLLYGQKKDKVHFITQSSVKMKKIDGQLIIMPNLNFEQVSRLWTNKEKVSCGLTKRLTVQKLLFDGCTRT